jgi:hypothetical protein
VYADSILEVAAALEDRSLPLLFARQATQQGIRERFETETAPDGTPWEAWSESYTPYAEAYPNVGILSQSQELEEVASRSDAFIISHDAVFYNPGFLPRHARSWVCRMKLWVSSMQRSLVGSMKPSICI